MEAAILHRGKDNAKEQQEKPAPSRVLALSDHRHINNIATVLDAVDRAIASLSENATPTSEATTAR
jgi:hypothetical protein